MTGFWTEKRKSIAFNGIAFGVVGAAGSIVTLLMSGNPVTSWVLGTAIASGFLGAAVVYWQGKTGEFETGAKAGSARRGVGV